MGVFVPPVSLRGQDLYTKLLLRGDALTDASPVARAVTNSNVVVADSTGLGLPSAFAKVLSFSGASTLLTVADAADLRFLATDAWTVDFWYIITVLSTHAVIAKGYTGSGDVAVVDTNVPPERIKLFSSGSVKYTATTDTAINTPYHMAFVCDGSAGKVYKGGVQDGTFTPFAVSSTLSVQIGYNTGGTYLKGKIANLRISKGIARWTRNFTPPQRPF